jgi:hypothetical protein
MKASRRNVSDKLLTEERKKEIRVIIKLPNSEQSYKGKVKTHKYINRQKERKRKNNNNKKKKRSKNNMSLKLCLGAIINQPLKLCGIQMQMGGAYAMVQHTGHTRVHPFLVWFVLLDLYLSV